MDGKDVETAISAAGGDVGRPALLAPGRGGQGYNGDTGSNVENAQNPAPKSMQVPVARVVQPAPSAYQRATSSRLTDTGGGYNLGTIRGYTRHGLNQAINRNGHGVSPSAILSAVENPTSVKVNVREETVKYRGANSVVLISTRTGKVITTWATNSKGWRHQWTVRLGCLN